MIGAATFVIDASAAVEYLLRTALGTAVGEVAGNADLAAPELMDAEVVAVLRRAVLRGHLSEERALTALNDLRTWPVERISHRALVSAAWRHRHNVTAYDAFYVAAARALNASLLTADGPLSRAPGLAIPVHNIRLGEHGGRPDVVA